METTKKNRKGNIRAVRNYVESKYGINAAKLSDEDVTKLAIFFIEVVMLPNLPIIAKAEREELGL